MKPQAGSDGGKTASTRIDDRPDARVTPQSSSAEVRQQLIDTLRLDLVGPWPDHEFAQELLVDAGPGTSPSQWYLTGFIVPSGESPRAEVVADSSDEIVEEVTDEAPIGEESADEGKTARKGYFPASIGLSFRIHSETRELDVRVTWGDYHRTRVDGQPVWKRDPREAKFAIPVPEDDAVGDLDVPDSDGLQIHYVTRSVSGDDGARDRTVSMFLVNRRTPATSGSPEFRDRTYAFQPQMEVRSELPFPHKPVIQAFEGSDWDETVARLHYADSPEYATGHGVSAEWDVTEGRCHSVRTVWIGRGAVHHTRTTEHEDLVFSMHELGRTADGAEAEAKLTPLVAAYREWIDEQSGSWPPGRVGAETAAQLLVHARLAADRMDRGIQSLAQSEDALEAFRVANRAVGSALQKRLDLSDPGWRPFQLAFILLNLPGVTDPSHPERGIVDLLFFPTGGGKTEAYLGLAALAMVLRRLRHPQDRGLAGAGVSVIMRYTLRLLTIDQLNRAAGLVCALELERRGNQARYGRWPFEIGLWVGMAATPNRMGAKGDNRRGTARRKVLEFRSDPNNRPSPIPLETCPWCRSKFDDNTFHFLPNDNHPLTLQVICSNLDCEFSEEPGLPVVAVDDSLYRRQPAFVIATVDKFAALPWTGESGVLLGGAERFDSDGFYGPCDPRQGRRLTAPLPPPDLIIQDELHLISGPLGTMAGLYEAAIEALCMQGSTGQVRRPKIVASTATIRGAQDQVHALFGRSQTRIFPPPGPDRRDSFFAHTVDDDDTARFYLGIAAQGRSAKVVMRKVWVSLMGAAMKAYFDAGGDSNENNPADPYMSLVGYFNSLRELGGGRRIFEEEVRSTLRRIGLRRRVGASTRLYRDRMKFAEVVELTSRVPTNKVAEARLKLGTGYRLKPGLNGDSVDCAIATNMISVGLDIPRLGLMTVIGQPKTAAEYIQATSRVGRTTDKPGLVVTLLNVYRPRDRSHYERFKHFHHTFYRSVEVASVTPFSARALDKGLAGALVAVARHAVRPMTPAAGASRIRDLRAMIDGILYKAFVERAREQPADSDSLEGIEARVQDVRSRVDGLLDSWVRIRKNAEGTGALHYQKYEGPKRRPTLLSGFLDEVEDEDSRRFRAGRSLRDVEPEVSLQLLPD